MKIVSRVALFSIMPVFWSVSTFAQVEQLRCDLSLAEMYQQQSFLQTYHCAGERLATNPDDLDAIMYFARAALVINQPQVAEVFAEKALASQLSQTDRLDMLYVTGVARTRLGDEIGAITALRAASNYAQTDAQLTTIRGAMAQARQASPWDRSVSISVDPSNNINNGSRHDTEFIFGLPFELSDELVAQPGIAYRVNGNLSYTDQLSESVEWTIFGAANFVIYDGLARNDYSLRLGGNIDYLLGGDTPELVRISLGASQRYLADVAGAPAFDDMSPYYYELTFGLEYFWNPQPQQIWSAALDYAMRISDVSDTDDAEIFRLSIKSRRQVKDDLNIQFGGFAELTDSQSANSARMSYGFDLGLDWQQNSLPILWEADLSYRADDYRTRLAFDSEIRSDDILSLTIGVTPTNWQWYGFQPTFGIELQRQFSNIRRFDTENYTLFTRINSVF